MRKIYETPVAEVVSFAAMEQLALLERSLDEETNIVSGPLTPGGSVADREGGY